MLPPLSEDTVLRLHWVGKRDLSVNGTALYFIRLWNLPETQVLESKVLNQFAVAPWRLLRGEGAVSNAPVDVFRWLLESIESQESYMEIRSPTNGAMELVVAVQVPDEVADAWQSNLAVVVHSLTGFLPARNRDNSTGWFVRCPQPLRRIEYARRAEWSVFGITHYSQNEPMTRVLNHLHRHSGRLCSPGSNYWLTADIDLHWLAASLGIRTNDLNRLPQVSLAVTGDGGNALTFARLTFSHPLPKVLESWMIPNQLIHEPLISFSAARGIQPLFRDLPWWQTLQLGEAPEQLYCWSTAGNPLQTYLAIPMSNASARMGRLETFLLEIANRWLKEHGPSVGDEGIPLFNKRPGSEGLQWSLPGVWPYVKATETGGAEFLFVGLTPEQPGTAAAVKEERIRPLQNLTNLVLYGWESPHQRLNALLPVLQTTRILARRPPLPDNSLSLVWLGAIAPRLGETESYLTQTAPDTLELHRKSTVGFSALELHLIADWLESPQFPKGLHTFHASPPP